MIDNFIEWSKVARAKVLKPLFSVLTSVGIRPNHLTFFRLLSVPVFWVYFPTRPDIAVSVLLLGTLIDWFDGGLARYQNNASDRGKFWDVLVDHLLYVGSIFGLLLVPEFPVIQVGYQLLIGPVLFLLATIVASEKTPTDWIIHPYYRTIYFKPFGLLAFGLYAYFNLDLIKETLIVMNIAMSLATMYYAVVLTRRWSHENAVQPNK